MKTIHSIFVLTVSVLLLASCSVENLVKEEPQPDNAAILTSNSPWTFESYKVAWVIKTEKDTITDQEIETEINGLYKN